LLGVGVGVGVGVTEDVGVGVTEGVGVGVVGAVDFGAARTPLFQTSFLPLLTHVYFLPAEVEVAPSLEHVAPAFTAATAFNGTRKSAAVIRMARSFFTEKG